MDEAERLEKEIQQFFKVDPIGDRGLFVIYTPIKLGCNLLELYVSKTFTDRYRISDDGYIFADYLFDEKIEEQLGKSAQKFGFKFAYGEVEKYVDDSKDIVNVIFKIVEWYYTEARQIIDIN
mgnify:CR=1 FL=1